MYDEPMSNVECRSERRRSSGQDLRQHRRVGRRVGDPRRQGQEDGRLPHVAAVLSESTVRRHQQIRYEEKERKQRDKETERQRDSETEKERKRERERLRRKESSSDRRRGEREQ